MSQLHPEFTGVSFVVFIFQVIHITGRLRLRVSLSHGRTVPSQIMGLVVVAHALPPPTINEVRIDCHMFVTRVNMDLNIIYCENRYSFQLLFSLFQLCVFFVLWALQKVPKFVTPPVSSWCCTRALNSLLSSSPSFSLHSQRIKVNLKL